MRPPGLRSRGDLRDGFCFFRRSSDDGLNGRQINVTPRQDLAPGENKTKSLLVL
jgi:hypothetical protein